MNVVGTRCCASRPTGRSALPGSWETSTISNSRIGAMNRSDVVGQASSLSPRASCPRKKLGLEAQETGWKPVLLSSGSWRGNAFTLVELLVVIAIIALLAAQ